MKKQILTLFYSSIISFVFLISPCFADHCCPGDYIHEAEVGGYRFGYTLIDIKEKMKNMKDIPQSQIEQMKNTHHLMLYIKNTEGKELAAEKVGFLIIGPDENKQKIMALGMNNGYGSDIDLSQKGDYKIKAKAVIGGKSVMDSFLYKME